MKGALPHCEGMHDAKGNPVRFRGRKKPEPGGVRIAHAAASNSERRLRGGPKIGPRALALKQKMLCKQACVECKNRTRAEPWDHARLSADEVNWFNGHVWCPHNRDNGRSGWTDRRDDEAPEGCPFRLEHLVAIGGTE